MWMMPGWLSAEAERASWKKREVGAKAGVPSDRSSSLGCKAVIVMPSNAPAIKRAATLALGAEVVDVGLASSERLAVAEELVRKHGYIVIPPYDDEQIIAGQGTCGLEIVETLPDVDLVLAPVSGGGLLSGVAAAVKQLSPQTKVFGVESELAGDTAASFRSGKIVTWPAELTRS